MFLATWGLATLLGAACEPVPMNRPLLEPPLAAGCNPLGGGQGEDCFTPFPSSFYMARRSDGVPAVAIPDGVLPTSLPGVPFDPGLFRERDGYSPATPLLAYFPARPGRIDGSNLPGAGRVGESLLPQSPVQLFAYDSGERVPILVELDGNANPGERQALIIYPQLRLRPGTRYVVAISGLTSGAQPVAPLAGFLALREGLLDPGSIRSGQRDRYEDLFAFLARQGLPRPSLQLAWDFQTASDSTTSARLIRMRDAAFAYRAPAGSPPPLLVDKTLERPATRPELFRQIYGRMQVPSFLTDDTSGRLSRGADGEPALRGLGQFPLTVHIPTCAEKAMSPVPVLIYGHGLFGSGQSELDGSLLRDLANRLCMIQIATDWIGLAGPDRGFVISKVLRDFNQIAQITERLQQAQINFAYLAKIVASGVLASLPELTSMGRLLADKSRVYYYGISNGGIQGLTLLALSPHLTRAGLSVPGGFWSQMIFRSSNFRMFGELLAGAYPDPLDRQLLVALSQSLWDASDPATYAAHVLRDPLPGSGGPKRLLYQEGIGDAQVPNLATRAVVRTLGISLLGLPTEAVFGVGQVLMSAESAYVQYDIGQNPRPGDTNVPPERDNLVHRSIPRLEAAKTQLDSFLREDGRVLDTCAPRACSFPVP